MLTRLSAMLPINTRGMWIGTFHGLCNRMLRAHYREANLPQTFQILDSGDQLSAIKRLMKAMNVDDEKYPPREMQNFISGSKEQGLRAHEVEAYDPYTRRKVEVFAEYDAQCQREGVVDFSELLLRCYELLSRNAAMREHYQERFKHILVDEFQDTNPLQYRWLKLLAGAGEYRRPPPQSSPGGRGSDRERQSSIFAVGDDDQSIYAFRGANVGNMQELLRDFHVENVIKLEQNYRSHGNILDAANALISHNRNRLGKNLWTSESGGEPLRVYEAPTDVDEADFIVERDPAAETRGRESQRDRAAVPLQRAVARAGTCAGFGRIVVPRLWRAALLRAAGDQARAGLPAPDGKHRRRQCAAAHHQLPDARHRRAQHRAVAGSGQT